MTWRTALIYLLLFAIFVAAFLMPLVAVSAFAKCRTRACHHRVHEARADRWLKRERPGLWQWRREPQAWRAWVHATAQCESNGRWHIATGNGFYGGLQFTARTWFVAQNFVPQGMRTHKLPHLRPWYDQGVVAIAYAKRYGTGAWPACG